jgi:hypothetical protein
MKHSPSSADAPCDVRLARAKWKGVVKTTSARLALISMSLLRCIASLTPAARGSAARNFKGAFFGDQPIAQPPCRRRIDRLKQLHHVLLVRAHALGSHRCHILEPQSLLVSPSVFTKVCLHSKHRQTVARAADHITVVLRPSVLSRTPCNLIFRSFVSLTLSLLYMTEV